MTFAPVACRDTTGSVEIGVAPEGEDTCDHPTQKERADVATHSERGGHIWPVDESGASGVHRVREYGRYTTRWSATARATPSFSRVRTFGAWSSSGRKSGASGFSTLPSTTGGITARIPPKSGRDGAPHIRRYDLFRNNERRKRGNLDFRVWDPTARNGRGNWVGRSLKHKDRERAKDYAAEQNANLRKGEQEQKADARRIELWTRALGAAQDPETISRAAWQRFADHRASGAMYAQGHLVEGEKRKPVGPRTVERDQRFLLAVLNWRTEGGYFPSENCCRGFPPRGRKKSLPARRHRRPGAGDPGRGRTGHHGRDVGLESGGGALAPTVHLRHLPWGRDGGCRRFSRSDSPTCSPGRDRTARSGGGPNPTRKAWRAWYLSAPPSAVPSTGTPPGCDTSTFPASGTLRSSLPRKTRR